MNKRELTEADIRTKFITPALGRPEGPAWDLMTQVREEVYFTKGRVIVRGKTVRRGDAKKVDYLLFYKPNVPIAVIEAKITITRLGNIYCERRLVFSRTGHPILKNFSRTSVLLYPTGEHLRFQKTSRMFTKW